MSSAKLVPPIEAWTVTFKYKPIEVMTFLICNANSLVGARIRAWVDLSFSSILCKAEMVKVAVLPVPD